jgi:transcriptional regulator with XRE-family HTH domain
LSCRSPNRQRKLSSLFPDLYDRCLASLIEARKRAGITQIELAEKLGRPQSFVAKYEGRERRLDVAEYLMIARALGADPYRLSRAAERGAQ